MDKEEERKEKEEREERGEKEEEGKEKSKPEEEGKSILRNKTRVIERKERRKRKNSFFKSKRSKSFNKSFI